jgi:hypothetical protein
VNTEKTNKYWNHCVKLLKTYYSKNQIIIIDDNSNQELVKPEHDYKNITIIQTEYHKRGELLPYIYFLKHKWFDNAVIIHDSVFFHKTYNFDALNVDVLPLWYFVNNNVENNNILRIADSLNNSDIIKSYIFRQNEWHSCFGGMCYINHTFLDKINNKYNIIKLIDVVHNRSDRCALERIFGIIFFLEMPTLNWFFGDINRYYNKPIAYNYTFDDYIKLFYKKKVISSVVKVWTGR